MSREQPVLVTANTLARGCSVCISRFTWWQGYPLTKVASGRCPTPGMAGPVLGAWGPGTAQLLPVGPTPWKEQPGGS